MTANKTILLIDDEVDLLTMLKFHLGKKGYHVVTAQDGVEGLEKLMTLRPDLIVLDMNMPRMGGIEFYNRICDGGSQPKFPVFVLTARSNMESLFKDLDVKGFMAKPFEIDHLTAAIDKILAGDESQPEGDPRKAYFGKQVMIVDGDVDHQKEIAWGFLDQGFRVLTAHTGKEAIEHTAGNIPDFVLISGELADIPGDMLALQMRRLFKVHEAKFILYTGRATEDMAIMEEMRHKSGAHRLVESNRPMELLDAVKEMIRLSNT